MTPPNDGLEADIQMYRHAVKTLTKINEDTGLCAFGLELAMARLAELEAKRLPAEVTS